MWRKPDAVQAAHRVWNFIRQGSGVVSEMRERLRDLSKDEGIVHGLQLFEIRECRARRDGDGLGSPFFRVVFGILRGPFMDDPSSRPATDVDVPKRLTVRHTIGAGGTEQQKNYVGQSCGGESWDFF